MMRSWGALHSSAFALPFRVAFLSFFARFGLCFDFGFKRDSKACFRSCPNSSSFACLLCSLALRSRYYQGLKCVRARDLTKTFHPQRISRLRPAGTMHHHVGIPGVSPPTSTATWANVVHPNRLVASTLV